MQQVLRPLRCVTIRVTNVTNEGVKLTVSGSNDGVTVTLCHVTIVTIRVT